MTTNIVVKVKDLDKTFIVADGNVNVLKKISFEINEGEFAIIYGPSGCGKSTLLHTILGLEQPTSGSINVLNRDLYSNYSEDSMAEFRINNIGMVYQQSNWVKAVSVVENVALPLAILGLEYEERIEKAKKMLDSIHMLAWANYHPSELSSGQQQKVALARALITNPKIIIADEPTGNLDFESGEELMNLLKSLSVEHGKTILMVTHDLEYLKHGTKAIRLLDGQVQSIFSPNEDTEEMNNLLAKRKVYEKYLQ